MAKRVCCVALVLATIASIGKACTFSHAGFCVAVKAGTTAAKAGVAMPDGTAVAVVKDAGAPKNGYWMPGCSKVSNNSKAPSDGKMWTTVSATPTDIKKDAVATTAGVFCPTAKLNTCKGVAAGTKAGENGVAIPDGTVVAVAAGGKAPLNGFWCEGCQLLTASTAASGDGMHWTSPSATPTAVKKGANASAGVFCLNTLKKTTGGATPATSGASTMTLLSAVAISSMVGIFGQMS